MSTLLSTKDFTSMVGTCAGCGAQVAHYLCNAELLAVRPAAAAWDWLEACTNDGCVHHEGEGVFQDDPAWLICAPRA